MFANLKKMFSPRTKYTYEGQVFDLPTKFQKGVDDKVAATVKAITPLIVQCRRFWYAYHHTGEMLKGAQAHMHMAQGIASSDAKTAIEGTNQLMDYLEQFARKVVEYERVPDTPTLT